MKSWNVFAYFAVAVMATICAALQPAHAATCESFEASPELVGVWPDREAKHVDPAQAAHLP